MTFFVTGHRMDGDGEVARRNREVLRSEWQRGHLIGNHTYDHDLMDTMTEATLRFEIDRTEALITQVTGQRAFLLRAPFGALNHPARGERSVLAGVHPRALGHGLQRLAREPRRRRAGERAKGARQLTARGRAAHARHVAVDRRGFSAGAR